MYIFCCPNPEVLERDGDLNNKMQIMPYVAIQFLEGKFYNGGTIQGSDGTVGSGLWGFGVLVRVALERVRYRKSWTVG